MKKAGMNALALVAAAAGFAVAYLCVYWLLYLIAKIPLLSAILYWPSDMGIAMKLLPLIAACQAATAISMLICGDARLVGAVLVIWNVGILLILLSSESLGLRQLPELVVGIGCGVIAFSAPPEDRSRKSGPKEKGKEPEPQEAPVLTGTPADPAPKAEPAAPKKSDSCIPKSTILFGISTLAFLILCLTAAGQAQTAEAQVSVLESQIGERDEHIETLENLIRDLRAELGTLRSADEVPPEGEKVMVTMHGDRFHRPECSVLVGRQTRELSVSQAEEEGYYPCSLCKPLG